MNIALLIIYLSAAVSLGVNMAKHGEQREYPYSVFTSTFTTLIELLLIWWATGWVFI